MTLRPLDPAGDRPWLEALWAAALGDTWPPLPAGLDLVRDGVVAEERGTALGMVAVDPAGSILLLLVDPAHQRRGVGTRLLAAALHRLGAAGADTVARPGRHRDPVVLVMRKPLWVERRDFYVRVGYAPWRRYLMSRRQLTST